MNATLKSRLIATVTAGLCLALLLTAASLSADPHGLGTHEQLALPACSWPALFNAPCPTCGMTTAFTHASGLDLPRAFVTQPMGALLAVATSVTFWFALHSALTGSRALTAFASLLSGKGTYVAIGLLIAAWAYKGVTWPG